MDFLAFLLPVGMFGVIFVAGIIGKGFAGELQNPIVLGTFGVLLIGVIILVGALTFFPALLLGPIVQGLTGHLY